MPDQVKRRSYDASRRRMAADRRREAILEAAYQLFVSQGYGGTTMTAVAGAAGVALDTVYASVGPKPQLLRLLVEAAIANTDHPVDVLDRDYIAAVSAEPDADQKINIYAAALTGIQQRLAPLLRVLQTAGAAEPEVAAIWSDLLDRRAANMPLLIAHLATTGRLRPDLASEEAADTVWAVNSTELYQLFTHQRGWAAERYETWLARTLRRLLLTDPPGGPGQSAGSTRES
jgi:AcrR family transcriptional regulator